MNVLSRLLTILSTTACAAYANGGEGDDLAKKKTTSTTQSVIVVEKSQTDLCVDKATQEIVDRFSTRGVPSARHSMTNLDADTGLDDLAGKEFNGLFWGSGFKATKVECEKYGIPPENTYTRGMRNHGRGHGG